MILLGSALIGHSVMSLQTGNKVGDTIQPLIDPADLSIVAYTVNGLFTHDTMLVRLADVRELSDIGFIIDSIDELITPTDVIRVKQLSELNFTLGGITVRDKRGHKLGKVIDYTIETTTFLIQQLIVRRPLMYRLNDAELVIHRSQIVEINNDSIVVHSQVEPKKESRHATLQTATTNAEYVNPFRKPNQAAPESADLDKQPDT